MVHDTREATAISPLAGQPAPASMIVDLARLEREYYERTPDVNDPTQLVSFGTSGHRGSSFRGSFTEAHIAAITQAICDRSEEHTSELQSLRQLVCRLLPEQKKQ